MVDCRIYRSDGRIYAAAYVRPGSAGGVTLLANAWDIEPGDNAEINVDDRSGRVTFRAGRSRAVYDPAVNSLQFPFGPPYTGQ